MAEKLARDEEHGDQNVVVKYVQDPVIQPEIVRGAILFPRSIDVPLQLPVEIFPCESVLERPPGVAGDSGFVQTKALLRTLLAVFRNDDVAVHCTNLLSCVFCF